MVSGPFNRDFKYGKLLLNKDQSFIYDKNINFWEILNHNHATFYKFGVYSCMMWDSFSIDYEHFFNQRTI